VGARPLRLSLSALVVVAALATGLAPAGRAEPAGRLKLDGVAFSPELALTSAERSLGLMNRRRAPVDGMLFVFPQDSTGGFWMKNTLVPLTIVFFDRDGKRVRKLSMTPCVTDSCRVYSPGRRYRFALELPVTDPRPALRLGPFAEIRRLSRLSS